MNVNGWKQRVLGKGLPSMLALLLMMGMPRLQAGEWRDVVYSRVGERELLLDVFVPEPPKSDLLLVYVHGGAWRSGSKDNVPVMDLVERGYALASVDYRLSGEARFPANVHDIKAAKHGFRRTCMTSRRRSGFCGRSGMILASRRKRS